MDFLSWMNAVDIALRSQRKAFNSNQIDPALARAAFLQGMSPVLFAQHQVVPSFAVPAPIANPRMPRFGVTIFARIFDDQRKLHYLRWVFEVLALLILVIGLLSVISLWTLVNHLRIEFAQPATSSLIVSMLFSSALLLVVFVLASAIPLLLSAVCGFMLSMAGWEAPP